MGFTDRHLWDYLNGLRIDDVGVRSQYSNLGMGVLGQVLARRTGQSFESVLRERILQPLQMHETFVIVPQDAMGRLAQPHDAKHKPTRVWDLSTLAGAGALRSSLADMITWLQANMAVNPPLAAILHQPRGPGPVPNQQIALAWVVFNSEGRTIAWHNEAQAVRTASWRSIRSRAKA